MIAIPSGQGHSNSSRVIHLTPLGNSPTERYPGSDFKTLLPLTRLVIELVAWAREAPEIKPGPK